MVDNDNVVANGSPRKEKRARRRPGTTFMTLAAASVFTATRIRKYAMASASKRWFLCSAMLRDASYTRQGALSLAIAASAGETPAGHLAQVPVIDETRQEQPAAHGCIHDREVRFGDR